MAKDILKEAIADAKAVREVALANAKAALEEAFTPKLQSMLSAKLFEDLTEEYDEDEKSEGMYYDEDEDGDMDEAVGMEMDEDDMDESTGEADLDEEIDLEEILNELELDENEEVSEETVEEAKDEDLDEAKKDDDKDDMKEADDKDLDEAKKDDEEDLDEVHKPNYEASDVQIVNPTADYVHEGEEFDLDALLEEINNLDENNEDEVNEKVETLDETEEIEEAKDEVEEAVNPLAAELEETKAALETVRAELNEVNLLNSKLLYVNRIFKANTLDEAQKLRVVETLDNATNVKEAKLIYETIKDTFNVAKSKKESFKNKTKSLQEGLGMASKAAGTSTAPKKEVIAESSNMVSRFQKLANITINE